MSITITPAATVGAPQVNIASGNAAEMFQLLGIDFDDDWGTTTGPDFHGRVLLALAFLDNATADVEGLPERAVGRHIDCGRSPGYLAGRLTALRDLAVWACEHNTDIEWF